MAEGEYKKATLSVKFDTSHVTAKFGDLVLKDDTEIVKNAITSSAVALGVDGCLKLGGAAAAATAVYVATKSIAKNWPWAKTTDVRDGNVIEVSVPAAKESNLQKLFADEKLQKAVARDFEDLDTNLEGILGKEAYDKCGASVLELIKDVRVKSVDPVETDIPDDLKAMNIILGKVKIQNSGKRDFMAVAKDENGPAAINFIGSSADVEEKNYGGGNMMVIGMEKEDLKIVTDAHEKIAGDQIKITVRFSDRTKFERNFGQGETISDVLAVIEKDKGQTFHIARQGKEDEFLRDNLTLLQVDIDGGTKNLIGVAITG